MKRHPMIDWQTIIHQLSAERPIFHSEADFQHALAWKIHEMHPEVKVRLEYRPFATERLHVDLWLGCSKIVVAVELKYLTRRIRAQVNEEEFNLSNQAAQDIRRYDFVSDLVRLERICDTGKATTGYAILLTNDQAHWQESGRFGTADSASHRGSPIERIGFLVG